eukprot:9541458-Lingulodinium_polyedra.AAC.1
MEDARRRRGHAEIRRGARRSIGARAGARFYDGDESRPQRCCSRMFDAARGRQCASAFLGARR